MRRVELIRHEKPLPGELVHVEIKKLGRIPGSGEHRKLGALNSKNITEHGRPGCVYLFLHYAVDERSRLAHCEILSDE